MKYKFIEKKIEGSCFYEIIRNKCIYKIFFFYYWEYKKWLSGEIIKDNYYFNCFKWFVCWIWRVFLMKDGELFVFN